MPASSVGSAHGTARGEPALIGPNAVTRLSEAIAAQLGVERRNAIFARAALMRHVEHPPGRMVPDEDVAQLHMALFIDAGADMSRAIGREAGRLTALYLLANRIPRGAQHILKLLPKRLALRLLLRAIGRHAWTFAGAGRFAVHPGSPVTLTIAGGPVSRHIEADEPACAYYAATFETLLRALICPRLSVLETACEARGDPFCAFELRWG
jgi:divinyl protochlorophyllide a 8-vinyl-reductase